MKNKTLKIIDIVIIFAVILAAGAMFAFLLLSPEGDTVIITVDGREKAIMHLYEDEERYVEGIYGGLTIKVSNGKVFVKEADCPDKICQKMHPVSSKGGSIICLPNQCVIKVEGGGNADAITG